MAEVLWSHKIGASWYGNSNIRLFNVFKGTKIVVECDHQALKPLFKKQLKGAIYERWIAILQQFNFELRYKPGKDMQVADALSRAPDKSSTTGFESPDQLDPYFPYHTKNVGNIITPNGMPFTNLLCSDKSSDTDELQLNNIDILQKNLVGQSVNLSNKQTLNMMAIPRKMMIVLFANLQRNEFARINPYR
ncbi:unnamed protein product [Mytilus edulis]|uniref:Reverse transcriptase RNase H-like domain-containing protein n=1 Tax=Mytilus edulis TaxID=6550 RepID=A0A8S3S3S7_MYTED|nr:unnamed protein product [Mytilus edulis]